MRCPRAVSLTIALREPGAVRWGLDGWQDVLEQDTVPNPLGLHPGGDRPRATAGRASHRSHLSVSRSLGRPGLLRAGGCARAAVELGARALHPGASGSSTPPARCTPPAYGAPHARSHGGLTCRTTSRVASPSLRSRNPRLRTILHRRPGPAGMRCSRASSCCSGRSRRCSRRRARALCLRALSPFCTA